MDLLAGFASLAHPQKEHPQLFATEVDGFAKHIFMLKGGMGKKRLRTAADALATVPERGPA